MNWEIDDKWTLFLDRDGVINQRIFGGYVTRPEDFIFRPDFLEAISFLTEKFGRIFVVTNQQGIGKGLMTNRNLFDIHDFMLTKIKEHGGRIDEVFFASNLKGETPDRRKPNASMAQEAKENFPEVDFRLSVMIGDTDSDIKFGKELGMKTVLLRSEEKVTEKADLEIESLTELINRLK